MLKGEVTLVIDGGTVQTLRAGEFYIVNRHSGWQLDSQQDNIVMIVGVTPQWLVRDRDSASDRYFSPDKPPSWLSEQLRELMMRVASPG